MNTPEIDQAEERMQEEEEEKTMKNRQIDRKKDMQLRIDAGLHRELKIRAAQAGISLKTLVEGALAELLEVKHDHC